MAFQFVHMELYARKADKAGRSVAWVLAEAARAPDACPHVESPQPPQVLYGVAPDEVQRLHDGACDGAKATLANGRTRAIRSDQKTLMTIVASHPAPSARVRSDPKVAADVSAWEQRTVEWLRQQYGSDLVSVVRHTDETYAHLHAYVIPDGLKAMALHPGAAAKRAVMDGGAVEGEDAKALNRRGDRAYVAAMRTWQDDYWTRVGLPSGLTRLGPGRRRLSRAEWQSEQVACASVKIAREKAARLDQQGAAFVRSTKASAAEMISAAEAEKAAAVSQMKAARRLHDASVEMERQAKGLLSRARKDAFRIIESARLESMRLASIGTSIRFFVDGWRRSSIERRARLAAASDVAQERQRADEAAQRAADESRRRQDAEWRAREAAEAVRVTAAERDRARRELEFLRPVQPAPSMGMNMGRKP